MYTFFKKNFWIVYLLFLELDFCFDAVIACGYFVARKAVLVVDIIGLFNKNGEFCEIIRQVRGLSKRRTLNF